MMNGRAFSIASVILCLTSCTTPFYMTKPYYALSFVPGDGPNKGEASYGFKMTPKEALEMDKSNLGKMGYWGTVSDIEYGYYILKGPLPPVSQNSAYIANQKILRGD